MSAPTAQSRFTVDHYLAIERAAPQRHEYLDGDIFQMAGESSAHGEISVNLVGIIWTQLKESPCRARTKDTKVRSGPSPRLHGDTRGMFSYPDLVVICGEPEFYDDKEDVVVNPTVIAEVLSPATESFDRGEKMARFQLWNPSLRDYLLISQDRPQIEHYSRRLGDEWTYRRYCSMEETVHVESINCSVRLRDVYDRVTFGSHSGTA